ncbi:unnamed protein product [Adineta ricciae]|uniref:Fibrous sheath-interacting protein 1 n=1 Tax=Adineta ricciae TaxID=249248 RepID=A0A815AFR4_ADIRI|nr:unnamed protein product [Adineta ricciae]
MAQNLDDIDDNPESEYLFDERSVQSAHSFVQDDEENAHRTSSSLNNYCILPPIKSTTKENNSQQPYFIKQLQDKYQSEKNGPGEMENEAKLDDAYLKMKRLDRALEEAFEKEKQVKIETMSLMKKLRNEMQSMGGVIRDDTNELSHAESNLRRFLALDDEILRLDGYPNEPNNPHSTESIFKTQLNDPLDDSHSTHKSEKGSVHHPNPSSVNSKKKSSISSNSTLNNKRNLKKDKMPPPEKDFIKRNIQLAKEAGGTWALTDDEKQRLNQLLNEDEQANAVALANEQINGYIPSFNENQRLKEIDDLLEKEYYNPLLNHQLRKHNDTNDIDYSNMQQITNEENDQLENQFGERTLKETRLQREHTQRLRKIDEKLEDFHRSTTDDRVEAILSEEQLNELLGQCAVDEMKTQYSLLNRENSDQQAIDFDGLSNYALTHYVENTRGPMITDEIIQLLLNEAQQEGIIMRQFPDDEDNLESLSQQHAQALLFTPAIDRPSSSTSIASHTELSARNLK